MSIYSNIVQKDKVREVQTKVLKVLEEALMCSFGPYGSNTMIYNDATLNKYTKDGHEILKGIKIMFPIESAVQRDLVEITTNTVKGIGDGTTSSVILSSKIFNKLKEIEDKYTPQELMNGFKKATDEISKQILTHTQEFDADMAYKIAIISTNRNIEVANTIKHIYETHGNDVYVNVNVTTQDKTAIKTYDGLTLKEGLYSSAYMNIPEENKGELKNAHIYYFDDPIDSPEMISLLQAILVSNIFNNNNRPSVPTVILTPYISRDMSSYIENIENVMKKGKGLDKPPIMIINNIYNGGTDISDIVNMCGCKPIKKYIDRAQHDEDVKNGIAPTPENVYKFCGKADMVVATSTDTKFINPQRMVVKDENGLITGYSDDYYALVEFVQNEIKKAEDDNADSNKIGGLKKRLHNLKANLVEYVIGGITLSDREALKALVEDAVLNCRSAAEYGVGFGANFEGLRACKELLSIIDPSDEDDTITDFIEIIFDAYTEVITNLYKTMKLDDDNIKILISESLEKDCPYNMVTKDFDGNVLSSIMSDVVILDSISRLLTLLFTCNQFLVQKPQDNIYNTGRLEK